MMPYAGEVRPRLGGSQFSAVSASVSNTTLSVLAPGRGHGGGGDSGAVAGGGWGSRSRVRRPRSGIGVGGGRHGIAGSPGRLDRRFDLAARASLSKAGMTCPPDSRRGG